MRKVFVELKVKLIIEAEEGIEISEVIQEMDYDFSSNTKNAVITNTEILDHEVTDSK